MASPPSTGKRHPILARVYSPSIDAQGAADRSGAGPGRAAPGNPLFGGPMRSILTDKMRPFG